MCLGRCSPNTCLLSQCSAVCTKSCGLWLPVFAAGEVGVVVVALVVAVGGGGDGVPVELGGDDCGEDSCGIANVGGSGGGKLI